MGKYFSCSCGKIKEYKRTEIKPIPDDTDINDYLEERDINFPVDEILCPNECEEVPEILNFHSDNKTIEFNCKRCGSHEMKIGDFIRDSGKNYLKSTCHLCQKNSEKNKNISFFLLL